MAESQRHGTSTGLALREPVAWHDFVQIVETAEQTGYDAVFVPEGASREAFATMAGLAPVTTRIRLGSGVVPISSRSARTTAMAAATAQEISSGRFILGIGAGFERSLDAMRAYVAELRGAQLGFDPGSPPPIWLAALGDRMIDLAGEVADGVLLNWCTPDRVARARRTLRESADRAGRDPEAITLSVYIRGCLEPEQDVAQEALQRQAAQYAAIPHYRRQFEAMGLGPDADERLVREVCLLGDPKTALERLQEYRSAGADLPVVYPVPVLEPVSSLLGTVLALAPKPALEA
jgi:5,10-methylenetetrahydromethanopterin reductase